MIVTMLVAVVLQLALSRYAVGGRFAVDLVLVGVIYVAFHWGPLAGMLAGTVGGIVQDSLADDVIGVGSLVKTVLGFAAGVVGAQFIVARPAGRAVVVAGASVVHRLAILALYGLIDQRWSGVPWTDILGETLVNMVAAVVAFQATESLPGMLARGRARRRSSLGRRRW